METKDIMKDFEALAKPLVKWLNENFHPHVTVQIDCTRASLMEGMVGVPIEEFIDIPYKGLYDKKQTKEKTQ